MEMGQGSGSLLAALLIDALFSECGLPDRSSRKWRLPVDNLHFLSSPLLLLLGVVICLYLATILLRITPDLCSDNLTESINKNSYFFFCNIKNIIYVKVLICIFITIQTETRYIKEHENVSKVNKHYHNF